MKKTGTIKALNISPKGYCEGFLLQTGKKIAQINLPKGQREESRTAFTLNEKITIEVGREEPHGEPAHDVFRMVNSREGGSHSKKSGDDERHEFDAKVISLNFALHGEVNGGILDSGDFLHLKPEGARALKLKVGMHVEGQGCTNPMADGHSVIDATEVNGIEIHRHKGKKHSKH